MLQKSLSIEWRVAITLWCLATPTEYQSIAQLFGIVHLTICEIVPLHCGCSYERLNYIPLCRV